MKTHLMFSVHTAAAEKLKNTVVTGYFGFLLEENLAGEFSKCFKKKLAF